MPAWLRHPILYFCAWYTNVQSDYHERGLLHVNTYCIPCWNGDEFHWG